MRVELSIYQLNLPMDTSSNQEYKLFTYRESRSLEVLRIKAALWFRRSLRSCESPILRQDGRWLVQLLANDLFTTYSPLSVQQNLLDVSVFVIIVYFCINVSNIGLTTHLNL